MNTLNTLQGPYVFISYSHLDEAFAKYVAKDLNARGIQTWIDETGIKPGSPDWDSTLRQVISKAFAFILIASPNISSSTYVKGEVAIAKAQSRDIYPVWAHGTAWVDCVPINLINMQYIDMRGQYYAVGLDKLVATTTYVKSSQGTGGNDRARQQAAQRRVRRFQKLVLVLGLLCRHQTQVGRGADLSRPDKTNLLERQ